MGKAIVFGAYTLIVALTAILWDVPTLPLPVLFIVLGLAASHAGRSISYYSVGEGLRKRWTHVVPHSSGAGEDVHPNPGSVLGDLLACPICSGTLAGFGMLLLYASLPEIGTAVIVGMGAAGLAGTFTRFDELLEWTREHNREKTGKLNRENKGLQVPPKINGHFHGNTQVFKNLLEKENEHV